MPAVRGLVGDWLGTLTWPRVELAPLFDQVVLSGESGLRKPDPRAFRYAARALGLRPGECVFVDDLRVNVAAAVGVGMVGVHHVSTAATVLELEAILGVPLTSG